MKHSVGRPFFHVYSRAGARMRSLLAGAFAAALAGALPFVAAAQQQQAPAVTAAKPIARDIVEDDEFVGRFEAVDSVDIRSRVAGYLDSVHFRDGAIVARGDLLFTIDRRPYQAAYDAANSQVDVATSMLEFSQTQLDRAEQLAKTGNLSVSALDDRRREFLSAKAVHQ